MTSPLDLPALAPTLIIVWTGALLVSLAVLAFSRSKTSLPIRFTLLRWGGMGCLFTITGIAQMARDRGLITVELEILTTFASWFAAAFALVIGRLQTAQTGGQE